MHLLKNQASKLLLLCVCIHLKTYLNYLKWSQYALLKRSANMSYIGHIPLPQSLDSIKGQGQFSCDSAVDNKSQYDRCRTHRQIICDL